MKIDLIQLTISDVNHANNDIQMVFPLVSFSNTISVSGILELKSVLCISKCENVLGYKRFVM